MNAPAETQRQGLIRDAEAAAGRTAARISAFAALVISLGMGLAALAVLVVRRAPLPPRHKLAARAGVKTAARPGATA